MTTSTSGTKSTSTSRTRSTTTKTGVAQKPQKPLPPGYVRQIDLKNPPKGMNPALAAKVRAMRLDDPKLQPDYPKRHVTHCNEAVQRYAQQFGYKGLAGLNADQMNKLMSNPKSGLRKVTEAEAIKAAQAGKLTLESVPASAKHAHGHVAAVVGEFAPGKAGIAQAGTDNYEWGAWRRETPSFFVRD